MCNFLLQRFKSLYSNKKEEIRKFYQRQEIYVIHQKHVMTGIESIQILKKYIIMRLALEWNFARIPKPDPRDSGFGPDRKIPKILSSRESGSGGFKILKKSRKSRISGQDSKIPINTEFGISLLSRLSSPGIQSQGDFYR